MNNFRAVQRRVRGMLSAGKQRQIDAALQCQAGAGTADDAGAADKEYVHARHC